MLNPRDFPEGSIYGDGLLDPSSAILDRSRKLCFWGPFRHRHDLLLDRAIIALETIALALAGAAIAASLAGII